MRFDSTMRWIRVSAGVLVGVVIWVFAFLVSDPRTLCYDDMPAPAAAGPGYYGANYEMSRAPLPIPAARCTTELEVGSDVVASATALVIDWTATALASLGIVLIAVTLWTLKLDANNRRGQGSPGRAARD